MRISVRGVFYTILAVFNFLSVLAALTTRHAFDFSFLMTALCGATAVLTGLAFSRNYLFTKSYVYFFTLWYILPLPYIIWQRQAYQFSSYYNLSDSLFLRDISWLLLYHVGFAACVYLTDRMLGLRLPSLNQSQLRHFILVTMAAFMIYLLPGAILDNFIHPQAGLLRATLLAKIPSTSEEYKLLI